jgi:hypothetical protein
MYHLISGVIAVAIFAALTGLVWLGGDKFTDARLKAELVSAQQQEQQIGAALTFYKQENFGTLGVDAAALATLHQTGYLKEIPKGDWSVSSESSIWKPLDGQTVQSCARMNALAGFDAACPPCDSENDSHLPLCQKSL